MRRYHPHSISQFATNVRLENALQQYKIERQRNIVLQIDFYCISRTDPGSTGQYVPGRLNFMSLLTSIYTPSHRLFTQQRVWCGAWALDHQSLCTSKPLHFRYIRSMRSAARKGPILVWSSSTHTQTYTHIHTIWQRLLPSRDSYRYRSNHNKKHMNFSPN